MLGLVMKRRDVIVSRIVLIVSMDVGVTVLVRFFFVCNFVFRMFFLSGPRRWKGCRCYSGGRGGRGVCRTDICPCWKARRECDPEVCGRCKPRLVSFSSVYGPVLDGFFSEVKYRSNGARFVEELTRGFV